MAEDDTTTPAAPTLDYSQLPALLDKLGLTPPAPVQHGGPGEGGFSGFIGDVGKALAGGGSGLLNLSPDEEDRAGRRALLNASINMLMASGPSYVPRSIGQIVGYGLQGAQEGYQSSELATAQRLAAQQAGQEQQYTDRMQAVKAALPLLQMQMRANLPNPFAQQGSGGGGGKNTSIGAAVGGDTYEAAIGGHEGLGADPRLPSTVGGFRPDTWQGFVAANPDLFKGMTPEQQMAARSDPKLNAAGISWLAKQNADALTKGGVTPSGMSLGVAHYLGAGAAAKALQAPDNTPVSQFVSPEAIKFNPELGTMTVGQLKQRYANVPSPSFLGGTKTAGAPPPAAPTAPPAAPAPGPVKVASVTPTTATDATPGPAPAPPATPAPDATSAPPVPASPEDYIKQHWTPLTPEEVQRYAPGADNQQAVTAAEQVQRERANLADMRLQAAQIHNGTLTGDPNKAADAVTDAQKALDAAQNNYTNVLQTLKTEGAKNLLTADNQQKQQLRSDYQELQRRIQSDQQAAANRQNTIDLKHIEAQEQRLTNREAPINQANQAGLEQAVKDQTAARNVRVQTQGFRAISDSVGQPNWLQTTKMPGSNATIAEALQQAGVNVSDNSGVQLLRGAMTNLTRTLREGMAMGALSDRDLDFIERMGPTEWMDKDTRTAAVAYLGQAAAAREKFSSIVQKEMARGKNYADAVDVADAQVKPFVAKVPNDLANHWTDMSPEWIAARQKWSNDNNVGPGTLFDFPDGKLALAKTPMAGQR
jgi:hypothetical protein